MANPYLTRKRATGRASERRVAATLRAKPTPASGALPWAHGDMNKGRWRIEAKSTVKDSISLKLDWLEKIQREANEGGKFPALTVTFVTGDGRPRPAGDWAMIPLWVLQEMGWLE